MNVLYISSACPNEDIDELNKRLLKKLQVSSNKYHNALISGLVENDIHVFSLYGLPITRKLSKKVFWFKKKKSSNKCNYIQLGFINISIIKYLSLNINLIREIKKIINHNRDKKNIIIFDGAFVSIYPTIKMFINKIDTYAIIADVYEYMADVNNPSNYRKIVVDIVKKYVNFVNKKIKGFIFLNKNMNELYNSNNFVVIEGIASDLPNEVCIQKKDKKVILYAGGLLRKFGIDNLVNAFMSIDNPNYELHLYGYVDDDMKNYIRQMSSLDDRIKYFGMQPFHYVVEKEKEAILLVNPRPTCNEFQKYSFPSKIIEYMTTGTPVITTKIDGMPEEYDDYLFYFDGFTTGELKKGIEAIISLSDKELLEKGKEAFNFIRENKNPRIQVKKILRMVEGNEKNKF